MNVLPNSWVCEGSCVGAQQAVPVLPDVIGGAPLLRGFNAHCVDPPSKPTPVALSSVCPRIASRWTCKCCLFAANGRVVPFPVFPDYDMLLMFYPEPEEPQVVAPDSAEMGGNALDESKHSILNSTHSSTALNTVKIEEPISQQKSSIIVDEALEHKPPTVIKESRPISIPVKTPSGKSTTESTVSANGSTSIPSCDIARNALTSTPVKHEDVIDNVSNGTEKTAHSSVDVSAIKKEVEDETAADDASENLSGILLKSADQIKQQPSSPSTSQDMQWWSDVTSIHAEENAADVENSAEWSDDEDIPASSQFLDTNNNAEGSLESAAGGKDNVQCDSPDRSLPLENAYVKSSQDVGYKTPLQQCSTPGKRSCLSSVNTSSPDPRPRKRVKFIQEPQILNSELTDLVDDFPSDLIPPDVTVDDTDEQPLHNTLAPNCGQYCSEDEEPETDAGPHVDEISFVNAHSISATDRSRATVDDFDDTDNLLQIADHDDQFPSLVVGSSSAESQQMISGNDLTTCLSTSELSKRVRAVDLFGDCSSDDETETPTEKVPQESHKKIKKEPAMASKGYTGRITRRKSAQLLVKAEDPDFEPINGSSRKKRGCRNAMAKKSHDSVSVLSGDALQNEMDSLGPDVPEEIYKVKEEVVSAIDDMAFGRMLLDLDSGPIVATSTPFNDPDIHYMGMITPSKLDESVASRLRNRTSVTHTNESREFDCDLPIGLIVDSSAPPPEMIITRRSLRKRNSDSVGSGCDSEVDMKYPPDYYGAVTPVAAPAEAETTTQKRRRIRRVISKEDQIDDQDDDYDNYLSLGDPIVIDAKDICKPLTDIKHIDFLSRYKYIREYAVIAMTKAENGNKCVPSVDENGSLDRKLALESIQNLRKTIAELKLRRTQLQKDLAHRPVNPGQHAALNRLHFSRIHGLARSSVGSFSKYQLFLPPGEVYAPDGYFDGLPFKGLIHYNKVDPEKLKLEIELDKINGDKKNGNTPKPETVALQMLLSKLGKGKAPPADKTLGWELNLPKKVLVVPLLDREFIEKCVNEDRDRIVKSDPSTWRTVAHLPLPVRDEDIRMFTSAEMYGMPMDDVSSAQLANMGFEPIIDYDIHDDEPTVFDSSSMMMNMFSDYSSLMDPNTTMSDDQHPPPAENRTESAPVENDAIASAMQFCADNFEDL